MVLCVRPADAQLPQWTCCVRLAEMGRPALPQEGASFAQAKWLQQAAPVSQLILQNLS